MSVRPTDLQIVTTKAEEVGRIKQAQHQQPQTQQQQIAQALEEEHYLKRKQTNPSPKSEEAKIRDSYHSRVQKYIPGKREKREKKEERKKTPEEIKKIDVKI